MSAGEDYLPPVLDDEANRFINKTAFDKLVVKLLSTIVNWGCSKAATQTYFEYLQQKHIKNKWIDKEKTKLNATDCSTYDVTFIVQLIPLVCRDTAEQDDTEFKCHIVKLKNFRNDDFHEPEAAAVSNKTLGEIKALIEPTLNLAGKKYDVKPDKILETIGRLIKEIDEIEESVMTEKQKRMIKLKEQICKEGTKEIADMAKLQATEKLLFSNADVRRSDVFHPSRFSVDEYQSDTRNGNPIKSFEGLVHYLTTNDSIIITGQPGSGKSTLSRTIREDFGLPKPQFFTSIKDYSLLLYMECGVANLCTIPELLRNNFPNTLKDVSDEEAAEVLRSLKLLIVVDGIDESTECSKKLLSKLLDDFGGHGNATFIFTSRPGAVQILKSHLNEKGLTYFTASIEPLTDENEQKEYLMRYQQHVKENNATGLVEAFSRLNDPCKDCLILPVYLSLFCHLYCSSPRAVADWKNELGIMEQARKVSEDLIRKRLHIEKITDEQKQNELVTTLMASLCDLSVGQVLKDNMTLDETTYRRLCSYCFGDRNVHYYTILSCVVMYRSHEKNFRYVHKTQAEFLAACAILKRLESNPELSIRGAISKVSAECRNQMQDGGNRDAWVDDDEAELSTEEACKYENTFKFLIMMLWEVRSEKPPCLFQRCLREVCQTLTDGDTPFSYWAELYLSCASHEVAEAAAEAARTVVTKEGADPWWHVKNSRYMHAAIVMLKLQQPPQLEVEVSKPERGSYSLENTVIHLENASNPLENASSTLENASASLENASTTLENASTTLETLLKLVAERFKGMFTLNLWQSYRSFTPIDKLLSILLHSNCKLWYFAGCLEGDSTAWQVLRDCLTCELEGDKGASLFISLLDPRQHQLDHLNNTPHILILDVKMTTADKDERSCRLPMSKTQPPTLTVVCSSDEGDQVYKVAALFIDLAPEDKRYFFVIVQQCKATNEELNALVKKLSEAGLRTPYKEAGPPRWKESSIGQDNNCSTCGDRKHRPGEHRCVHIELPKPSLRINANFLKVTTEMDMTLVTEHLPRTFFPWLVVFTRRAQPVPSALEPLMKAIGKYHKGTLDLCFQHSDRDFVPVDELLAHLDSAQCSLVYFRGCLRGDCKKAWRALTEGVLKAERDEIQQSLAITLLEPRQHMLHLLEETQHRLELRTRLPLETSVQGRRPLPELSSKPAVLKIDCSPTEGAGQPGSDDATRVARVAALIKDLAPGNMKHYNRLDLQNWPGSNAALDKLIAELSEDRVSSSATGSSSWEPSYRSDGLCSTCQESGDHALGQRCVQLEVLLPEMADDYDWGSGSE